VVLASAAFEGVIAVAADESVAAAFAFYIAAHHIRIELDVIVAIASAHVNAVDVGEIKLRVAGIVADDDLIAGDQEADVIVAVGASNEKHAIGLKFRRQKRALFQSFKHSSLSRCDTVLIGGVRSATVACSEPSDTFNISHTVAAAELASFSKFPKSERAQL
jgi:hypothetical protein